TSPNIDSFAKTGVLFTDASAQSSWTKSAITSIFTSLYPQVHQVNDRYDALNPAIVTLAEVLHRSGYQTAAISANGNINRLFGLDQGFESYKILPNVKTPEVHQLSDRVNEEAFRWLQNEHQKGKPFFLFLHTLDPHEPYTPREPFRSFFARGPILPYVGSS